MKIFCFELSMPAPMLGLEPTENFHPQLPRESSQADEFMVVDSQKTGSSRSMSQRPRIPYMEPPSSLLLDTLYIYIYIYIYTEQTTTTPYNSKKHLLRLAIWTKQYFFSETNEPQTPNVANFTLRKFSSACMCIRIEIDARNVFSGETEPENA